MKNLTHLDLFGLNKVSDLSPLSHTVNIKSLNLYGSEASDFSVIRGLAKLEDLNLGACRKLSDLSDLSNLAKLKSLGLWACRSITDLSPLEKLEGLESLNLRGCDGISDLSPLEKLMNLKSLDILGCKQISDLTPLANLGNLERIILTSCPEVSDLGPLRDMIQRGGVVSVGERLQTQLAELRKNNIALDHRVPTDNPPSLERLSILPLEDRVAEAKAIVVATILDSAPVQPKQPGDVAEVAIRWRVTRILKGDLADEVITTQKPGPPVGAGVEELAGKEWILFLSPEFLAGKHPYAGCRSIKLEQQVRAILSGE